MAIVYWKCYLSFTSLYLSMICYGAITTYPSPAFPDINKGHYSFHLTTDMMSWLASFSALFAIPGSIIMIPIMDIFGRKCSFILATIPLATSWLLIICSRSVTPFAIGRAVGGLSLGMIFTCNGVYASELAPKQIRGKLNLLVFMCFNYGGLLINLLAIKLNWQWLAVVSLSLVALTSITSVFLPESPRWLVSKGYREAAAQVIESVWKIRDSEIISKEIDEITKAHIQSSSLNQNSFRNLLKLFKPPLWKPLLLTQSLYALQILTGLTYISTYTVTIFAEATGKHTSNSFLLVPNYQSGLIFLGSILGNACSLFLIDRFGRRKLLIVANMFTCISLASVGGFYYVKAVDQLFASRYLFWVPLTGILLFEFSISSCFVIYPQLLVSELFGSNVRATVSALGSFNRNIMTFIIVKVFPKLSLTISNYGIFWIFAGFSFASVIVVALWVPETKGMSLEEIHNTWYLPEKSSITQTSPKVRISHL